MQEWEISAAFDVGHEAEAKAQVAAAWAQIERAAPGFPKVDAKRRSRADRLARIGDHGILVGIVAQWLSAKARASAAPDARSAAERVAMLAEEVEALQRQLAEAAAALRYAAKNTAGEKVADLSYLAEASLREALPALRYAAECAREMGEHMPSGARGRAGVVGALREAPPDDALALDLANLWTKCGLSVDGGEDGDGLDRFLAGILGEGAARKALTNAREILSTKNRAPK